MADQAETLILTDEAKQFLVELDSRFETRRQRLLQGRKSRQRRLDRGEMPGFLPETTDIRQDRWRVAPIPEDLQFRRVEITGPVDAKMMINALNSGADTFMADFEDATSPTWSNLIKGQLNVLKALEGHLRLETADKIYEVAPKPATVMVRPRGWHLPEKHFEIDGRPISASLFDFGLFIFHGGRAAIRNGSGPYLYLPKLESYLEARLWNDVFVFAQEALGIPIGTIKATVLIENILAAFEMDEILYELRDHAAGLNAGRWDYIFSVIRKFREHPSAVLPDRSRVSITVPFMKAYTDLIIETCHRRGAHAMGGMSAFIPNRRDTEVTERAMAAVRADKQREARAGNDGTWVAHPDLVDVAMAEFRSVLCDRPHQVHKIPVNEVAASNLLHFKVPGEVTQNGLIANLDVGLRYLVSWLSGKGAAAIDNLMEDVATAEISRSQIWQWVRHGVRLEDGTRITEAMVRQEVGLLVDRMIQTDGLDPVLVETARKVFEEVALADQFQEFLTLTAYEHID